MIGWLTAVEQVDEPDDDGWTALIHATVLGKVRGEV